LLFARNDEIIQAWRLMDPILQSWATPAASPLVTYAKGSWGPKEADRLLAREGHRWLVTEH
jgi:glucose-6-phosphate 1-dehydrogenase